MMNHIFISYCRKDAAFVDQLVEQIEGFGYQVWIDRASIQAGEKWRERIVDAIETSSLFLVILTKDSIKSDNLRKEIDLAESSQIPIIPISVKGVEIPKALKYQLAGLQRYEIYREKGFGPLIELLDRYIEPEEVEEDWLEEDWSSEHGELYE